MFRLINPFYRFTGLLFAVLGVNLIPIPSLSSVRHLPAVSHCLPLTARLRRLTADCDDVPRDRRVYPGVPRYIAIVHAPSRFRLRCSSFCIHAVRLSVSLLVGRIMAREDGARDGLPSPRV